MAKARLGVALLVPPPVDRQVDALRQACGDGSLGRIPPHVTLVPPVNVREDRLGDALAVLQVAAAAVRPLRATLGPPATFLPMNPVLYLAVGADSPEQVQALGAARALVFRDPLARPLTWPFVPHVTLADEIDPERARAAVAALADYRAEVRFDRLHLLRERSDRCWEPIAEAPFAAPAVVGRGGLPLELSVTDDLDPGRALLCQGEARGLRALTVTARREGAVVGAARGWTEGPVAVLVALAVAPPQRGAGVGSHVLAAFESAAAERGCRHLVASLPAGSPGEGLLRSRGWVEEDRLLGWEPRSQAGDRAGASSSEGVDVVRLRRQLG